MSNMEKIKIVKIATKQQPSKFKPGETYTITTVLDEKNRKLTAMGAWAEGWKVGDEIEATIEEKKWTDRDGFDQISLNLKNPNQKKFTPRGSYTNPVVVSYQLAATLASLLFANKKKVTLTDIDKLAEELKKRIDTSPAEKTEEVKKPEAKKTPEIDVDEEDDGNPF